MSRICRNMEDSGKHRFHDLEHDRKMRLFTTYSHTSTLRGYEASGKMLQPKTSNEERETGKRVQNTPANGGIDRRESHHFQTRIVWQLYSSCCIVCEIATASCCRLLLIVENYGYNRSNQLISTFRRLLRVDLRADIHAVIVCSRFSLRLFSCARRSNETRIFAKTRPRKVCNYPY